MSIANYGELRTAVADFYARTDIPTSVYVLATAELNARLRLRQMEAEATLSTGGNAYVDLPADFLMARDAYLDTDPRVFLTAQSGAAQGVHHSSSGRPGEYNIVDGRMYLNPEPDGTYSVVLRYVASLADFSADADTNDVLADYPALYLYCALKHAAVWARDMDAVQLYGGALTAEIDRIGKASDAARYGGALTARANAVA